MLAIQNLVQLCARSGCRTYLLDWQVYGAQPFDLLIHGFEPMQQSHFATSNHLSECEPSLAC